MHVNNGGMVMTGEAEVLEETPVPK